MSACLQVKEGLLTADSRAKIWPETFLTPVVVLLLSIHCLLLLSLFFSLIRVCAVCLRHTLVPSYFEIKAKALIRSANALSDLSLCWAHTIVCWWLNYTFTDRSMS